MWWSDEKHPASLGHLTGPPVGAVREAQEVRPGWRTDVTGDGPSGFQASGHSVYSVSCLRLELSFQLQTPCLPLAALLSLPSWTLTLETISPIHSLS